MSGLSNNYVVIGTGLRMIIPTFNKFSNKKCCGPSDDLRDSCEAIGKAVFVIIPILSKLWFLRANITHGKYLIGYVYELFR